LKQIFLSLPEW
jgi:hypothetical protein